MKCKLKNTNLHTKVNYINDGFLPMTNSLDERTIRPFAVGRKTGYFQRVQKEQMQVHRSIILYKLPKQMDLIHIISI